MTDGEGLMVADVLVQEILRMELKPGDWLTLRTARPLDSMVVAHLGRRVRGLGLGDTVLLTCLTEGESVGKMRVSDQRRIYEWLKKKFEPGR